MTTIIEYIAVRACERMQHNGNEFSTANFQSELSRVTDSKPMVTPSVAEAILLSTHGVCRQGLTAWSYGESK